MQKRPTFCLNPKCFGPIIFVNSKCCRTHIFVWTHIFLDPKFIWTQKNFKTHILLDPNIFETNIFLDSNLDLILKTFHFFHESPACKVSPPSAPQDWQYPPPVIADCWLLYNGKCYWKTWVWLCSAQLVLRINIGQNGYTIHPGKIPPCNFSRLCNSNYIGP